jgi:chemotaxis protein methyltransferase CheR
VNAPLDWNEGLRERFRALCIRRWGFVYRADDVFTLRDIVERAYQASDAPTAAEFLLQLESLPDSDPAVQAFVGRMVVGETSFFRHHEQFDAIAAHVLPELVAERRRSGDLRLRIWSAGCASGEEPYSIAILLATMIEDWRRWDIRIFATDLNPFALRRASEALYSDWSFREADAALVDGFFTRVARLRRLDHPCRSLVTFRRHNLATDPVPDPVHELADLDIVVCRNVTIYFERALTARLAGAFFDALRPGGWLVVGHTEPDAIVYGRYDQLELPDAILYRRPREGRPTTAAPERVVGLAPLPPTPPGSPPVVAPARLDDAVGVYEGHDLTSAFELLCDVAGREPSNPVPPHLLAQISADEKRYDEALYWAFTALQCDAFHVPTLMLMGLVFLERGDASRAKSHFKQALYLSPTSPAAHLYLSMAHRALGAEELAARSSARAARLSAAAGAPPPGALPVERARLADGFPGARPE